VKTRWVTIAPSLHRTRIVDIVSAEAVALCQKTGELGSACVESVHVDMQQRMCRLGLTLWSPVDPDALDQLRCRIVERLPGCEHLELETQVRQPVGDLEQWLYTGWPQLVRELVPCVPAVNGWLASARCRLEAANLVVEIENQAGVDHLKAKKADELLATLILKRTGRLVRVLLRTGDFSEQRKAMEDQREEELRRCMGELLSDSNTKSDRSQPRDTRRTDPSVIYGKGISAAPVRVADVLSEEPKTVIQGRVFAIETRTLKNGKTLVSFCITDGSDSIQVKAFEDEQSELAKALSEDDWVIVEGATRYDQFSRELVVMARSIAKGEAPSVEDDAPSKRVELHLHTKMSAMDSVVECSQAVKLAAKWGHPAIAITDHGVVQSFPEAFKTGAKCGIKIILGMEGYLADDSGHAASDSEDEDDERSGAYHIVILVKNQSGLKNLYRLVSQAHLEHFYKKPRILREELVANRDGLLLGTACEAGELYQAMLAGESHERLREIAAFYDYLEIQPIGNNLFMLGSGRVKSRAELEEINRRILALGRELGKPVVATGDVHYLRPDDAIYRAVLMAGQKYEDADNQAPLYLRTTAEMLSEFEYLGEADAKYVVIDAPRQIADMVSPGIRPLPEGLHSPKMEGAEDEIRTLCLSNAQRIYGDPLPVIVEERLSRELSAIIKNGFAVNYLIAYRVVSKSLEAGFQVGSRGSVGSSLVATMCHISEVNPLPPHYVCPECKYSEFILDGSVGTGFDLPSKDCPKCGHALKKDGVDIPFETFLGFKGDKVPDIDLNFADVYLGTIHRYTEELFGSDRIYRAGTIATIADKTAYGFVRAYAEERGKVLRSAEITRLVRGITGVKRSTGQHPGGLLVVPDGYEICDFCPVQYPADNTESRVITSHFSYHDSGIEECLTKLDLLGKVDPTTLKMLQDLTGLSPEDIPIDDPDTMRVFSGLEPLGVSAEELGLSIGSLAIPEFNTPFLRQILEDIRPTTIDELIRIMGLSHGKDVWLNNAQDIISNGDASSLSEVICCRDDIMLALIQKGMDKAQAFSIMETVRKGRLLTEKDQEAILQVGMPKWYLDSCRKITYLFPKAHAAAYVLMAVRLAYFKVHYPHEFYAAYLSTRCNCFDVAVTLEGPEAIRQRIRDIRSRGDEAPTREQILADELEVILEAQLRGVRFLPVDIDRSEPRVVTIENKQLRMPFVAISGLGIAASESIVSARNERPFTSIEDLRNRTKLTKTIIDLMSSMGILSHLPETDQLSLFA
jgi:DNA polymerase-3 subunit alpha (Gram-positive type)